MKFHLLVGVYILWIGLRGDEMEGYSLFPPIKTRPSFGDMNCVRELSAVPSRPSILVHFCAFGDLKHGFLVSFNNLMSIMDRSIESNTHRLSQ